MAIGLCSFPSGLLGAQAVLVSPPSLPPRLDSGSFTPCPSQLFPFQAKVCRVVLFLAFLQGVPASTSPVCLCAFPSSLVSVCLVCLCLLRCGGLAAHSVPIREALVLIQEPPSRRLT